MLDIFPVVFEGGKLVVNKGLSSHFQISHTMTMSSLQPSGYKFGCTYVGTKQYSPSEVSDEPNMFKHSLKMCTEFKPFEVDLQWAYFEIYFCQFVS